MAPLDKEAKYDRQLRLWAANGQAALESTRIALLYGNAVGTETLKNLILPGVGSYTIIDDQDVTATDTGVNFFLDLDCIGQSRAQKVSEYLQELNPDVSGQFLHRDPVSLVRDDPSYLVANFDIVLVTNLDEESLLHLSRVLWDANIPLVVVNAVGFTGTCRIAIPEHTIVESHPDAIVDLRLDTPWPELSALAEQMDLDKMNDNEHTHVPYVLLLLHFLTQWRKGNGGQAPSTFEEKSRFKAMIRDSMRNVDEDNFDEAVNNVWRACGKTSIPSAVQTLLQADSAQHLTPDSDDFWFLVRALGDFVREEGNGYLPVAGTVPDMKSDTARFITLQKTYRAKAMADITAVKLHLIHHLKSQGRLATSIADHEVESFCKHAAYIKVIRYRSLEDELLHPDQNLLGDALSGDAEAPVFWYIALRASQKFKSSMGHYPGRRRPRSVSSTTKENEQGREKDEEEELSETELEMHCQSLFTIALDLLPPSLAGGASSTTTQVGETLKRTCREVMRSGHGELHNVASFMGGVAAQEMIKIVTRQYIPVDNTVVFDGIRSVSAVYSF